MVALAALVTVGVEFTVMVNWSAIAPQGPAGSLVVRYNVTLVSPVPKV